MKIGNVLTGLLAFGASVTQAGPTGVKGNLRGGNHRNLQNSCPASCSDIVTDAELVPSYTSIGNTFSQSDCSNTINQATADLTNPNIASEIVLSSTNNGNCRTDAAAIVNNVNQQEAMDEVEALIDCFNELLCYADSPTGTPTGTPTSTPTSNPTVTPTGTPTANPSITHSPTSISGTPTGTPTGIPTGIPTVTPSAKPTAIPTVTPTAKPSISPSPTISFTPTSNPTVTPTVTPTVSPTVSPLPTSTPTGTPTGTPTIPAPTSPDSNFVGIYTYNDQSLEAFDFDGGKIYRPEGSTGGPTLYTDSSGQGYHVSSTEGFEQGIHALESPTATQFSSKLLLNGVNVSTTVPTLAYPITAEEVIQFAKKPFSNENSTHILKTVFGNEAALAVTRSNFLDGNLLFDAPSYVDFTVPTNSSYIVSPVSISAAVTGEGGTSFQQEETKYSLTRFDESIVEAFSDWKTISGTISSTRRMTEGASALEDLKANYESLTGLSEAELVVGDHESLESLQGELWAAGGTLVGAGLLLLAAKTVDQFCTTKKSADSFHNVFRLFGILTGFLGLSYLAAAVSQADTMYHATDYEKNPHYDKGNMLGLLALSLVPFALVSVREFSKREELYQSSVSKQIDTYTGNRQKLVNLIHGLDDDAAGSSGAAKTALNDIFCNINDIADFTTFHAAITPERVADIINYVNAVRTEIGQSGADADADAKATASLQKIMKLEDAINTLSRNVSNDNVFSKNELDASQVFRGMNIHAFEAGDQEKTSFFLTSNPGDGQLLSTFLGEVKAKADKGWKASGHISPHQVNLSMLLELMHSALRGTKQSVLTMAVRIGVNRLFRDGGLTTTADGQALLGVSKVSQGLKAEIQLVEAKHQAEGGFGDIAAVAGINEAISAIDLSEADKAPINGATTLEEVIDAANRILEANGVGPIPDGTLPDQIQVQIQLVRKANTVQRSTERDDIEVRDVRRDGAAEEKGEGLYDTIIGLLRQIPDVALQEGYEARIEQFVEQDNFEAFKSEINTMKDAPILGDLITSFDEAIIALEELSGVEE